MVASSHPALRIADDLVEIVDALGERTKPHQMRWNPKITLCGPIRRSIGTKTYDGGIMFPDFEYMIVDTGEAMIRVRHGGSGPPVLLVHGHPRTHVTWDRVATCLARHYTIVCPDLRGYGESSTPPTTPDHEPYSRRAMARDCVSVMRTLGFDRFAIAGHDRRGCVAQRLALDFPDKVTQLALLDVVPIGEALARCDATFARRWWHWFFLAQPAPKPERAILADPEAWYAIDPTPMSAEASEDIRRAIHDPDTVHAM